MWGPGRATVNIARAGGEKGEAQRGFISYVFNVCLSDIPASQSLVFPSIFIHTLSATYLQNTQYHISLLFKKSTHKRLHRHTQTHTQTPHAPLFHSWDCMALKNNTNGQSTVPQQYHCPGRILNRWVLIHDRQTGMFPVITPKTHRHKHTPPIV